jgi:pimeloyl-ACP methyl ester carboxylesterase
MIWHDRHDLFGPFPHGQWLASHVPGATVLLLDDHGHRSMWTSQVPA